MKENGQPIFIHSLFRSGSTYIFNAFRRSDVGYCCYQEPLHELTFFARNSPDLLHVDHGEEKLQLLRHPRMDRPYFQELFEAWPAWQAEIDESLVYSNYFEGTDSKSGVEFWKSLIERSKKRPVFQECRTSGRIKYLKRKLGGLHLYLWRNPWDQWWSYKVNEYFDTANQLIVHASSPPNPLRLMLNELELSSYDKIDIGGAFAFYGSRPLTSEQSYLIFYMLWCLGMREGLDYADTLISIDKLSDSIDYQNIVKRNFLSLDIKGIDFSDCCVPQGFYCEKDKAFFHAAESKVHLWLIEGGWKQAEIDLIQQLRNEFAPKQWGYPVTKLKPTLLMDFVERFSQLAKRFETANAKNERAAATHRFETQSKLQQLEKECQDARIRDEQSQNNLDQAIQAVQQGQAQLQDMVGVVNQSNRFAQEAQSRATQFESLAQTAQSRADQSAQMVERLNAQLAAVYSSKSWRITAPLRWPVQQLRLLREHGLKNRIIALTKKILRKINRYLLDRPALRHRLLRLSQSVGVYNILKRWRDLLRVSEYTNAKGNQVDIETELLPTFKPMTPRARQIYEDLMIAINQSQKGDS